MPYTRTPKYPTNNAVFRRLRELHSSGIPMAYKPVKRADIVLLGTIRRKYLTFNDAVKGAGLKPTKMQHGGNKPRTVIKTPTQCSDYAYFLGVLFGDGNISRSAVGSRNTVKCDGFDIEMCRNFAEKGKRMFGIKPKWLTTERTGPHRANHGDTFYRVAFYSNNMADYLIQETADKTKIPEWIKKGANSVKAAFIRGFADAEGCAKIHGNLPKVSIVQKAREWLDDIRGMLSSMGISSRIYFSEGANCYSLNIYRILDVKRFAITVGFSISRKQNRLVLS